MGGGAWVHVAWWPDLVVVQLLMGCVLLLGVLEMTTYNRQPARQRGVEVELCGVVGGGVI